MPSLRLAAAVLLLGAAACAQRRWTPPEPDTATKLTVEDLYQQARNAIYDTPTAVQPELLVDVARDEMRLSPQQGLQDFQEAFALALALPTDNPEKAQSERDAVGEIARQGDASQALDLARMADVPKAPIYDDLIMDVGLHEFGGGRGRGGGGQSKPASSVNDAEHQFASEVLGLAEECQQSDGTFPYSGVAMALRRERDPLDRLELAQFAYRAAANETQPTQMSAAVILLESAHRILPEMDGTLEATLRALLERLGQNADSDTSGTAASVENRLMALLTQIDPARADTMVTRFPGMGEGAMSASNLTQAQFGALPDGRAGGTYGGYSAGAAGAGVQIEFAGGAGFLQGPTGGQPMMLTFSTTVSATAGTTQQDETGSGQFLALISQAESQFRTQPGNALALANQAAGMLDDTLWQTQPVAIMRLATLYQELADTGDAARLMNGCLAQADAQARGADQQDYADDAQEAQAAQGYGSSLAPVMEIYSLAARLDLAATAAHAEAAQFVLLKPEVLARIALVGEVSERRSAAR